MARGFTSLAAAALIVAGGIGDHVLTSTSSNQQTTALASVAEQQQAAGVSSQSLDAATEHAFSVASPSVVFVNNVGIGSGSGVIYDKSGDIVTNAHVVESAQSLTVTLSTGKTYPARLVGSDVKDDLAVIHISASNLPAAHFASAGTFRVAQIVLAIGNPLDLQQSVTFGLISALDRTVSESSSTGAYLPDALQTSAPINPGNSGGALVTLSGAVVGIPTLEAVDPQNNNGGAAQGIGFAIPSTRVTTIAHQIVVYGRVIHSGRAYLGVTTTDSTAAGGGFSPFGQQQSNVTGAVVTTVADGSPAAQAGLQQYDVITAVDGKSITSSDDLLTALAHAKPNQTITLSVNRNGQSLTLKVKLGELAVS
jgi:S1-C subfamily serine protease